MADWINDEYKKALAGAPTHSAIDLDTDTIHVALLDSSYSINAATHVDFADVVAFEISPSGYTAGGVEITSKSISTASNIVSLSADDALFSGDLSDVGYAQVYKVGTSNGDSPLIFGLDFGGAKNGTTLTIQWNGVGVLRFRTGT